ncbi:uncharacterized protein EV422DRAFT_619692 [Fimicolochytrium jonesii]|uniref:uncharacterized protein n=1 Tax=Fimicolochytrium jonesii TaxID=1396493 RepID=UPI0022FE6D28|nr:uncharacterized protein EV422DRAFT_619692 [Fimicolochytrium jonesii]KAI8821337.1 hypothetical protein EV422DRAFT_619692 [Fimicolochytrium jonesii]
MAKVKLESDGELEQHKLQLTSSPSKKRRADPDNAKEMTAGKKKGKPLPKMEGNTSDKDGDKEKAKKFGWTDNTKTLLRELVHKYGETGNWSTIEQEFNASQGRTAVQLRNYWRNVLKK